MGPNGLGVFSHDREGCIPEPPRPDDNLTPIKKPEEEMMPPVTVPVPIATSYFQYDQQGVVFNMCYFGWFDDAMTQFLGEVGYPYTALNADGLDVQLVHTEADWRDAVRYGEQVVID